ncbi:MAG: hypothetical protein J0L92_17130 [Deltaproteobacteria bacterium]|nr:hypothetical protein [Deltaproteobacteria bacterium]
MTTMLRSSLFVGALLALSGCPGSNEPSDAGRDAAIPPGVDAPLFTDAPVAPVDSGPPVDAHSVNDAPASDDAFSAIDAPSDAPVVMRDAFVTPPSDGGMCMDLPPDPTRPAEIVCSPCRPPGVSTGGGGRGECETDADCTEGTNGRCGFGRAGSFCSYDLCFSDADCDTGEACLCDGTGLGGGGNTCVSAGCRTNNDCTPGHACSPTFGGCGHYAGFIGFQCHTAEDECTTDADCGPGYCAFDATLAHWACSTAECVG